MSIFGLHTQGEVDLLVLRAIKAGAESMAAKSKEARVLQIVPFPKDTAREAFAGLRDLSPFEAGCRAALLVKQISDHYHKQLAPLQKELELLHRLYPEKVVLELEAIKTDLADLRRHLCDQDTK